MNWRTTFEIPKAAFNWQQEQRLLALGSCFAQDMAQRLSNYKFDIDVNPFGILYNPKSIASAIEQLLDLEQYMPADLDFRNGLWQSFDHHSQFAGASPEQSLDAINLRFKAAKQRIQRLDSLIITFGTAFYYEKKSDGKVVANCHKFPADFFYKKRIDLVVIKQRFTDLFTRLFDSNPQLNIVLSVSPVRHVRDGVVENQRSKALLLLLAEALEQAFEQVYYFPAYELFMDDLRDYRFAKADLVHPNEQALDYIWSAVESTFFEEKTIALNKKIHSIIQGANHRPMNSTTHQHQHFLNNQLEKIKDLENIFPFLNFEKEKSIFKNQLKH